ncbi:hypothetical protein [Hyphococcus sp.]|uniref:hypothetical protein n=1 Tax=Hyphococcus sp. TaxID=2038636 RepID=UPI003D125AE4
MPQQFNALSPYELLLLYRGDAIGAYGAYEQAIARCFIQLAKTDHKTGSLIFFKIVNTRTRLSIMDELLKEQFYPNYKKFWDSAFKHIRDIDHTRNKVVHWLPISELHVDEKGVASLDSRKSKNCWLQPPDYWQAQKDKKELSINDILAFRHKTEYVTKNLDLWHIKVSGDLPDVAKTFSDKFQQSIPYPPPKDHPLYEPVPVWKNQPQSSRA